MSVDKNGLYEKFTVTRNEGKPQFLGNHFVLFPRRDPWAMTAMLAYADACQKEAPMLANDIRRWVDDIRVDQACICDAESTAAWIARHGGGRD